ncbi:MAG: hypothetical protein QOH32_1623 [Bradyrhizobium sp.]|nr:hypothetical protein [Bradyrhizobium sp.]
MSLVFYGALAAAFYTLVLGAVWPARDGSDFSAALLGLIAKSLWLSWLVVVVCYWLDLNNPLPMLLGAVIIALAYQWLRRQRRIVLRNPVAVVIVLIVTVGLCLFLFRGGLGSGTDRLIFMNTDPVSSWNNWAIELSRNTYNPYDGAYPVLFPGIWSLVYKAQGASSVWIFAKLTMFIIPTIVAGMVGLLLSSQLMVTALAYTAFAGVFFFFLHSYPMLFGNMDMPLAALCMAAGVAMVVAVQQMEHGKSAGDTVILAALFAGLASITKQTGATTLPPLLLLIAAGLWNRKLGRLDALVSSGVAAIPLATFLLMFLAKQPDPLGNLGNLQNIRQMAGSDPLQLGWQHVQNMLPIWMLATVGLLATVNLLYFRTLSGWMGVLFLALAIAGFFVFSKYLAYEERNGWWIISLLATSALFSVARFDSSSWLASRAVEIRACYLPTTLAVLVLVVAFMIQYRVSDEKAVLTQLFDQEVIAGYDVAPILKKLQPALERGDVLLTEYGMVRWFPGMMDHVALCGSKDKNCVRKTFSEHARDHVFVLIQRGVLEYPGLKRLLSPEKLMAESNGYAFYGPFDAVDAQLIED